MPADFNIVKARPSDLQAGVEMKEGARLACEHAGFQIILI